MNLVIKLTPNCVLIRLDHRWAKYGKNTNKSVIVSHLVNYLRCCLTFDQKIIADPEIYNWIDDSPSQETRDKYIVLSNESVDRQDEELNDLECEIIENEVNVLVDNISLIRLF